MTEARIMEGSSRAPRRRCDHCDKVIGVYEPVVVVGDDGGMRQTSRAAEPSTASSSGCLYHHACYFEALGAVEDGDAHGESGDIRSNP
jgi:hypothetical protein